MKKILLAVAPVAKFEIPGVNLPKSSDEVSRETINCAEAGASMVHLHVRDELGEQTADLTCYSRTLDLIRAQSNIIIQGSTGGFADLSLEERCVSLKDPRTQVASLNMGSTNYKDLVYINSMDDIRYWARRIKEENIVPEMELFAAGMMASADTLVSEGLLSDDPAKRHYNFPLGFEGALPADIETLCMLKSRLPFAAGFGVINEDFKDFSFLAGALALGATSIRVGFEDGATYAPGKTAESNLELVKKAVELIRFMGMDVMTIDEAKDYLGVMK